jgi:hypothetical protein
VRWSAGTSLIVSETSVLVAAPVSAPAEAAKKNPATAAEAVAAAVETAALVRGDQGAVRDVMNVMKPQIPDRTRHLARVPEVVLR